VSQALYFHDEMLSPTHPLLVVFSDLRRVFVFDDALIRHQNLSLKRIQFIADCVVEIPDIEIYRGNPGDVLRGLGINHVVTQTTPMTWVRNSLNGFTVDWRLEESFVRHAGPVKRFTSFWKKVEDSALRPSVK
jgi:deoxyribodipyrimidine photo-lyase